MKDKKVELEAVGEASKASWENNADNEATQAHKKAFEAQME